MTKLKIMPFLINMLLFFGSVELNAQCVNGTNTDPNPTYTSPQNSSFKTNTFDWRSQTFPIDKADYMNFAPTTPTNPLYSPFYVTSQYLSTIAGGAQSDFQPQGGWELIKQDFGYYYSNNTWSGSPIVLTQPNKPIAYFLLYNKYQAKLRVIATTPLQGQISNDKVSVDIEFMEVNNKSNYANFKYSALFNRLAASANLNEVEISA